MINRIYEYIAEHPMATHHQCAVAFRIDDIEAFVLVNKMKRDGYLCEIILPLGNEIDPQCSHFYKVKS